MNVPQLAERHLIAALFPGGDGRGSRNTYRPQRARNRSAAEALVELLSRPGVPVFSPHDLRHRRVSLLHRQGRTWAEIARFVGQRKLSVTADTYTHVLSDCREADYSSLVS